MRYKARVRHLAPEGAKQYKEREDICICLNDRRLVTVPASITGTVEKYACINCRKWFRL